MLEHASQPPVPPDVPLVIKTIDYLQACNKLFERGILGKHVFVKNMSSPILASMEEGYQFVSCRFDNKLTQSMLLQIEFIEQHLNVHASLYRI